jgi:uncharacterized membrane protein (UPF0136 family)
MTNQRKMKIKRIAILASASLVIVAIFLGYSAMTGFTGFPLDDAWIHQVYARNLAQRGEWAFNPGQPSGGSTSPLWSVLLTGGYNLRIDPVIWAALLGWLSLAGTAILAEMIMRRAFSKYAPSIPWVGLFMLLEWHLVWGSVSGMETAFYVVMIFLVIWTALQDMRWMWLAGILTGLAVWVRPDGVTLLGPVLFILVLQKTTWREKTQAILKLAAGFAVIFIPYLFFNLHQAGSIWPSTFSAKQAEYQAATALPLLQRIGSLFLPFLAGGGVMLLPGVIAGLVYAWRERNVFFGAIFLWFAGYILLYALRLPVFYQHGRYMIPAMAGYFLFGLWGSIRWMRDWSPGKVANLGRVFWMACLAVVTLIFLFSGCLAYRTDVGIIETEMVRTARWIKQNTPLDSRLAVHDIGAVGYYSGREVIDLAGLVNPEVIPFIREEDRLKDYLSGQNVQYLVTFPGWYPKLVNGLPVVYHSTGEFSPGSGGENMTIYQWK